MTHTLLDAVANHAHSMGAATTCHLSTDIPSNNNSNSNVPSSIVGVPSPPPPLRRSQYWCVYLVVWWMQPVLELHLVFQSSLVSHLMVLFLPDYHLQVFFYIYQERLWPVTQGGKVVWTYHITLGRT